ncbi:putative calmodulin [Trypanosoma grayi]|uniref:putative calmodulin n=1 Tax=Trypanosoma grayi TaxID=71804 RepID=UPI0004F4572B|nr:putative calmodulin [Trypanosoma grayi]KEG10270.1 putative calmodulin [Trypanosoma grayi]
MRYAVEPCASVRDRLTSEELRLLRDSFIRLDMDGDGVVKLQDIHDVFKDDMPPAACLETDETLDLVSYLKTFLGHVGLVRRLVTPAHVKLSDDEVLLLEEAFSHMDANGDGYIDEGELCSALMESLGVCGDDTSITWLAGVIMTQTDRDGDRRLSISELICALLDDKGVFPPQLITLPPRDQWKEQVHLHDAGAACAVTSPCHWFSPYEVFVVLRLVSAIANERATLTAVQLRVRLSHGLRISHGPLGCSSSELVSHLCHRALLLAPFRKAIGAVDCERFCALAVADPSVLLLTVPPPARRLELSMRELAKIPYHTGRHLTFALMEFDPTCSGALLLDEMPQKLRVAFPGMEEAAVQFIVRCCTAAADVNSKGGFSLQRLVRRLAIRYYVLPCGYAGKPWRRLSPFERSQIRTHLLHSDVESWCTISREELRECVVRELLESDAFWDQEYVASLVASYVETMVFTRHMPPSEVRRAMSQESWPPSGDLVEETCRADIAARMTEINLGREGLFAVAKATCELDTSLDGIINEELFLSTLHGVVEQLKPQWGKLQVNRVVCDVVLSCELTEEGLSVKCCTLVERLLQNQPA